jgi:endonuclease I
VLLNWYEQFPVGDYERHRNAAIFAAKPTATPLSTTPSEPAGSTSPKGLTGDHNGRGTTR